MPGFSKSCGIVPLTVPNGTNRGNAARVRADIAPEVALLFFAELSAKFVFCLLQHLAPSRRKIFASSVDVERQHGERGPMGIGFAPSAAQRRAAQRRGNAPGIFPGEYASIEVKRVTFLRDAC